MRCPWTTPRSTTTSVLPDGPGALPPDKGAVALQTIDLAVVGMTCSSCANRIERKLNKMDGVTASVNYATEVAHVDFPLGISVEDLLSTVDQAGYQAIPPAPPPAPGSAGRARTRGRPPRSPGTRRSPTCASGSGSPWPWPCRSWPLSMIPPLQFTYWQWLCFALASPVVFWGAWPFHRATLKNARHGAATMDTLVSMGCMAAYLWSTWALFRGGAGIPGYAMTESLIPSLDLTTEQTGHARHLPRGRGGGPGVPARGPLVRGARQA